MKTITVILLLGFLLRVWGLVNYPVGFTPDEASFGYDAYSILKTGSDQWGHKLPLILESFGDFKSPLYSYLTIPSVVIFGLNKFAIRLPNALLGTAAIYITYLLILELKKYSFKKSESGNFKLENLGALLLTISPWHIMMSRGAFEANLTTFFLPLAVLLFLKGLVNTKFFILSSLFFGLNLFTYHSAKFITPLVVAALLMIFANPFKNLNTFTSFLTKNKSFILIFTGFLAVATFLLFNGGAKRAAEVSIYRGSLNEAADKRIKLINEGANQSIARIIHNKYQVTLDRFLKNYSQYFSLKFLVFDGPAETTYGMMPGTGVIYLAELIFLGFFVVFLFNDPKNKALQIIMFWLIIAPVPAALTTGPGYAANRAVIMLPALQIAMSMGVFYFFQNIHKISLLFYKLPVAAVLIWEVILLSTFLIRYLYLSPSESAEGMLYGRVEAVEFMESNFDEGHIIMSKSLSEPHIYVAFTKSLDPSVYQSESNKWDYRERGLGWVDQLQSYELNRYTFKNIEFEKDIKEAYIVGKPQDFPNNVISDQIINYPDGKPAIYIFSPQKPGFAYVY